MAKTSTTAGRTPGLYTYNVGYTYNDIYKSDKITQKAINDKRTEAQNAALKLNGQLKKTGQRSDCLKGVAVGYCGKGHTFFKPVFCEKESCQHCGQDRSPAHYRRCSAVIDTVLKWNAVSYLVITIPEEIRSWYLDKKALNNFRNYIRRKLKADGFTTAALRWHWAGTCKTCQGKKNVKDQCIDCNGTGAGDEWHPHLNILLPSGNNGKIQCFERFNFKKEYLNEWRKDLQSWFKKKHPTANPDKLKGNIYANFIPSVGTPVRDKRTKQYKPLTDKIFQMKVRHRVRYIFRATLRNRKLSEIIEPILKRYVNTARIGQWDKTEHKPKNCPCCGDPLKWYGEPAAKFWERKKILIEVEKGLYFVNYLAETAYG